MKGLLHYQFVSYLRSYQYIPPFSLFIIFLIVNYTYTPNPILDSYSFTSLILFFLMGWFTVTIFHVEEKGQKQITSLHAQSLGRYYASLYILAALIGLFLSLVAVSYPIVIGAFGGETRPLHIVMGFLSHFSLAFLSIGLSAIFTREIVKNKMNTWWGILSILVISLSLATFKSSFLQIKGLIWLVPPVYLPLEMMTSEDGMPFIPDIFYWKFCFVFL
ncbi:MAG: ABC transporter permease, partial [Lysinibacillus sp.]